MGRNCGLWYILLGLATCSDDSGLFIGLWRLGKEGSGQLSNQKPFVSLLHWHSKYLPVNTNAKHVFLYSFLFCFAPLLYVVGARCSLNLWVLLNPDIVCCDGILFSYKRTCFTYTTLNLDKLLNLLEKYQGFQPDWKIKRKENQEYWAGINIMKMFLFQFYTHGKSYFGSINSTIYSPVKDILMLRGFSFLSWRMKKKERNRLHKMSVGLDYYNKMLNNTCTYKWFQV